MLEKAQQGQIQYLNVDQDVVTVSGNSPWLVRTWDTHNGRILSEWSFALNSPIHDRKILWYIRDETLVQIVVTETLDYEISRYDVRTGYNNGTTEKVVATSIAKLSE